MGASTVAQLIAKGQKENAYNNSGISSNEDWYGFFNDALRDLVDDLRIEKVSTITFVTTTREYDLPADYYAMGIVYDSSFNPQVKRRNYAQRHPAGYWIFYRGSAHVIDLYSYTSNQTLNYTYMAYPTAITATTDSPEVPSVGEKALIYYALSKALRNNNQVGQAKEMEEKYEAERLKIRTAAARGGG